MSIYLNRIKGFDKIKKRKALGFVIATILMVLLFFHFLDIGEIASTILSANPLLYGLAVLCIVISIVSWGYRWKVFINGQGYSVKTRDILGSLMVGLAINNITPIAKLGGEPVRAYLLKKNNGVSYSDGLASVVADGSIFLVGTVFYVLLSIIVLPLAISPPSWLLGAIIAFACVMGLFLLALSGVYRGSDYIVRFIEFISSKIKYLRERKDKILDKYLEFRKSFRNCLKNKKSLAKTLSALGLAKVLNIAAYFFIFMSLGHPVSILHIFIVTGISQLVLALPATPGSLGVYEGAFVSLYALLGVNPAIAGSAVLLQRLIWFWSTTAVGGYLGTYYGVSMFD